MRPTSRTSSKQRLSTTFGGAVLAAAMLSTLAAPGVAAVARPTTFDFMMGDECVLGHANDGANVKFEWRSAAGALKYQATTPASTSDGSWFVCTDRHIAAGDVLKAKVGQKTRQLTVPQLTLIPDRVNNVLRGRAPAGTTVHLDEGVLGDAVANSKGRWSFSNSTDIVGGSLYGLHWLSPQGDSLGVWRVSPSVMVTLDSAVVGVHGQPNQKVVVRLYEGAGFSETSEPKAVARATTNSRGGVDAVFRDKSGHRVRIQAGDHLSAPGVAADADWLVPDVAVTADAATEIMTGRCFDTGVLRLGWFSTVVLTSNLLEVRGATMGRLNADGTFEIDYSDPTSSPNATYYGAPGDITSGDRVEVTCMHATGDYVSRRVYVP
jgi:hypothetical protein